VGRLLHCILDSDLACTYRALGARLHRSHVNTNVNFGFIEMAKILVHAFTSRQILCKITEVETYNSIEVLYINIWTLVL
jgi:hypothetical protein